MLVGSVRLRSPPVTPIEPVAPLTPTEIEVVRLIASGLLSLEVERRLQLGRGAVRELIQSILEKLQAHARAEAVVRARDLGPRMSLGLGAPQTVTCRPCGVPSP